MRVMRGACECIRMLYSTAGLHNIGRRHGYSLLLCVYGESMADITLSLYSKGAFLFSQATLPLLLAPTTSTSPPQHPPTLIFTGATASVKGSALFAAFATMKFALRALAQSLAREFGPQGVHVAHAVIDGVIDIPRTQNYGLAKEAKIDPEAIADAYWYLHSQPKTSFTWEIDIRPGVEKW